jgi:hypothetical protein
MPDTVAGLFVTRSEAEAALRKLKEAGFAEDQISVSSPAFRRPRRFLEKNLARLAIGAVGGAVLLALVAAVMPGIHALIPGDLWLTVGLAAIAGFVTGGVAGGLLGIAVSGDSALFYEQEVESGRVLVSVTGPRLEEAWALLRDSGAMEAAPVEKPLQSGRPRPEGG